MLKASLSRRRWGCRKRLGGGAERRTRPTTRMRRLAVCTRCLTPVVLLVTFPAALRRGCFLTRNERGKFRTTTPLHHRPERGTIRYTQKTPPALPRQAHDQMDGCPATSGRCVVLVLVSLSLSPRSSRRWRRGAGGSSDDSPSHTAHRIAETTNAPSSNGRSGYLTAAAVFNGRGERMMMSIIIGSTTPSRRPPVREAISPFETTGLFARPLRQPPQLPSIDSVPSPAQSCTRRRKGNLVIKTTTNRLSPM